MSEEQHVHKLHNYTDSDDVLQSLDIDVVFGEEQEQLLKEEREAEELLKHQDDVVDGDNLQLAETQIEDDGEETDRLSPVAVAPDEESNGAGSSNNDNESSESQHPLKERLVKLNDLLEKAQTYTQFLIEDGLMTEHEAIEKSRHIQDDQEDGEDDEELTPTRSKRGKRARGKAAATAVKKPKNLKYGQPVTMAAAGEMRYYQLVGMNWLISLFENGVSGILADEMGLGKTIQTISLLSHLFEKGVTGPFLVVAPLSTLSNWRNELTKWAPDMGLILYHGSKKDRSVLRSTELPKLLGDSDATAHVVITSYEMSIKDARYLRKIPFKYLVVDEAHRLKNFHCRLTKELKAFMSENRLLLTGTPLQNNLTELWSLLNFLIPELFDDLENFRKWFDFSDTSADGPVAEEKTKLINKLHTILRPFILRRMKSDVELDLPTKKEYLLYAPMTSIQQEYYRAIKDRDLTPILEKQGGVSDNSTSTRLLNILMQLRKTCNHPYLISEFQTKDKETMHEHNDRFLREVVNSCGKFKLLDTMLKKLKEKGHKVLIFSLMTRMLDVIEDYMELEGHKYCRLDGSVAQTVREERIKQFNEDPEVFCFLLSTRAGGLGINLTAADTVIIYDSDWNPQIDLQAQDRCHRIGQTKPVRVFRLLTTDSVEKKIWQTAQKKLQLEKLIIHKGNFKGAASKGSKITLAAANVLEILGNDLETKEEHRHGISNQDLELLLDRSREDLTSGRGYEVVDYERDNFMA